jgi:hypothetical protein
MTRTYELTDSQADWIADLLNMASDRATGIVGTTSGGGYRGGAAQGVFAFLAATVKSVEQQKIGGAAVLANHDA